MMTMPLILGLISLAVLQVLHAAQPPLVVPDWTWEPEPEQLFQTCLKVPSPTGRWYNETVTWYNDSRLLSIALPKGPMPAGGWPVMIDLLVIDFPIAGSPAGTNHPDGKQQCGLDGDQNPVTNRPVLSQACKLSARTHCGNATGGFASCRQCYARNEKLLRPLCGSHGVAMLQGECPAVPPLAKSCMAALQPLCNYTLELASKFWHRNCSICVAKHQAMLSNASKATGCPKPQGDDGASASAIRLQMEIDFCKSSGHRKPAGGGGGGGRMFRPGPHLRGFKPFASPERLAMGCSCINGSNFSCSPPYDDDHHGHPFVPAGGFCDFDTFAGGLWSQHLKQYLLHNGIAVMEANNYVDDGWQSWSDEWNGGYDGAFFKSLAAAMQEVDGPLASKLDPDRVAFRGWSGSAQMVSWLINQAAWGLLPGIGLRAGVMMAGGSHACYNWPGHGALAQCSQCNSSSSYERDPAAYGCSNTAKARGVIGGQPYCDLCCPQNYTEHYYAEHPEKYRSHPPTFLIQTELDSGADSCAALNYHRTMLDHEGLSEIGIVPLDQQRCFSIGSPGDPAVPAADTFQRFCSEPNATSLNHTQGFAGMVQPLARFLMRAFNISSPSPATVRRAKTTRP